MMSSKAVAIKAFRKACGESFGFLLQEHGFQLTERSKAKDDEPFEVVYVSPQTRVIVQGIHYGAGINVRLGRVHPEAWETFGTYDLEDLIRLRAPQLSLLDERGFGKSTDQLLQLRHYAAALRDTGHDVLQGDFQILGRLHAAIEERRKLAGTQG